MKTLFEFWHEDAIANVLNFVPISSRSHGVVKLTFG